MVVAYFFPDAVPSNKLCMAMYFHLIEKLAGWDAHCAAHNLHLVWRDGASECDFENPLYCLLKLLTHAGTGTNVQQGQRQRNSKCWRCAAAPGPWLQRHNRQMSIPAPVAHRFIFEKTGHSQALFRGLRAL